MLPMLSGMDIQMRLERGLADASYSPPAMFLPGSLFVRF